MTNGTGSVSFTQPSGGTVTSNSPAFAVTNNGNSDAIDGVTNSPQFAGVVGIQNP